MYNEEALFYCFLTSTNITGILCLLLRS